MKKVVSMLLAFCMIFISSSSVFAAETDRSITYQAEVQNEISSKISHYFTKDSNGAIHFTATKSELISLGISDKDAEIMTSFTSDELNSFAAQLDSSLVIGDPTADKTRTIPIQTFGFVGVYLKLGPKVRSMAAVPAGAFAGGFAAWHVKALVKAGPWGAGAAAAVSASVAGAVGWAVKNHLKTVRVGTNIPFVSWSRNVYVP